MVDNPRAIHKALLILNNMEDPRVIDFVGSAALYGVNLVELVSEYFKQFQDEEKKTSL